MAALSVPEREVIELSYFKAMSQSEIAAQLGLPLTTVRVIAASALVRMGRGLEAARA